MLKQLKEDLDSIMERDPAARSRLEVYLLYSGFKAVRSYRKANWFYRHNMKFIARWISQRSRHKTGIEIHPGAKIGKGLFIDHGMGAVSYTHLDVYKRQGEGIVYKNVIGTYLHGPLLPKNPHLCDY